MEGRVPILTLERLLSEVAHSLPPGWTCDADGEFVSLRYEGRRKVLISSRVVTRELLLEGCRTLLGLPGAGELARIRSHPSENVRRVALQPIIP